MLRKITLVFSLSIYTLANPLIIGVEDLAYMPYSEVRSIDATQGVKRIYMGYFKELLQDFKRSQGVNLEYKPLEVDKLYDEFYAKKIDLKIPDNPLWQETKKKKLREKIYYSDPITTFTDGLLSLKRNAQVKVFGTIEDFTPWKYQKMIQAKKMKLIEYKSLDKLITAVYQGDIDAAYFNIKVAKFYDKDKKLVFMEQMPATTSTYHISSFKHPDIIKEFNKYLKTTKLKAP